MNFKRINADIKMAEYGISPAINVTNDEYLYDLAAYHIQQAVEKELKYILHDIYGEDDTERRFKTHNISSLLIMINEYDQDFINNHKDIVDISDQLTSWEASSRYGENIVSTREDINKAINCAKGLEEEIMVFQAIKKYSDRNDLKLSQDLVDLQSALDDDIDDIDDAVVSYSKNENKSINNKNIEENEYIER